MQTRTIEQIANDFAAGRPIADVEKLWLQAYVKNMRKAGLPTRIVPIKRIA